MFHNLNSWFTRSKSTPSSSSPSANYDKPSSPAERVVHLKDNQASGFVQVDLRALSYAEVAAFPSKFNQSRNVVSAQNKVIKEESGTSCAVLDEELVCKTVVEEAQSGEPHVASVIDLDANSILKDVHFNDKFQRELKAKYSREGKKKANRNRAH